jgi:hypothetical protein
MNGFKKLFFIPVLPMLFAGGVHAEMKKYNVEVHFKDLTVFRGQFDYDADTRQAMNLQGLIDDVQMYTNAPINYQLEAKNDGQGGVTVGAYLLNTTAINPTVSIADLDKPESKNAYVAINFNAQDPTLGATDQNQIQYISCVAGSLMGTANPSVDDCMYQLSNHDPELSMPLAPGTPITFYQTITLADQETSISDCLFDWAENNYAALFAPVQGSAGSANLVPYYFRHYSATNAYLGIAAAVDSSEGYTHNHLYYLGPDGNIQDVGHTYDWLEQAGCLYLDQF